MAFGPGARANASIGRAIASLLPRPIGGLRSAYRFTCGVVAEATCVDVLARRKAARRHAWRGRSGAAIVLDQGAFATEAELQALARQQLSAHKVPSAIRFFVELPMTPTARGQGRAASPAPHAPLNEMRSY